MLLRCFKSWECEKKCGTLAGFRLDPNVTLMSFDDTLYKCETNACPINFRVESVEQAKDPIMVLGFYPDPVIPNIEDRLAVNIGSFGIDFD
jgi:hypothetical protein